jgi:CelD/BcsL family acetyltransferase involved in cellulose biosynthesis
VPYELFAGAQALERVRSVWQALEQRIPCSVFQTYTFALDWYETVGIVTSAEPMIVVYSEDGVAKGIFPACKTRLGLVPILTWLGGPSLQDYGDVVFDESADLPIAAFLEESLRLIRARARGRLLYLSNVRADSLSYPALESTLRPFKHATAPYVRTDQPFEDIVANVRSHRKKLHYHRSRLERAGAVGFDMLDASHPEIDDMMTWVIDRKRERYRGTRERVDLDMPGHVEFRRRQMHDEPGMYLSRLTLNGETIAANVNCVRDGVMAGMVSVFDERFRTYSPGIMCQLYLFKYCCEHGLKIMDMGWGGGEHKYMWTDTDVVMTTFVSNDLLGRAACAVGGARRRIAKRPTNAPARADLGSTSQPSSSEQA